MSKPVAVSKTNPDPPMVHLEFPPGSKVNGLADITLDAEVTVIVKGKVKGVDESTWNPGHRNLKVLMESVDIHGPAKQTTLAAAVTKAARRA